MAIEIKRFLPSLRRAGSDTNPETTRAMGGQGLLSKDPLSKDSLPNANPNGEASLEDLMGKYDRRYVRQNTID